MICKKLVISLSQFEEDQWSVICMVCINDNYLHRSKCADSMYRISVKLFDLFSKIQSAQKHHQKVLIVVINYFLYLVSKICEHDGKENHMQQSMEKIREMLTLWLNHHSVIGGSGFGGLKQQRVKEEIQVRVTGVCH